MGKNCYEKEKLPLALASDKSNILFFAKKKQNRVNKFTFWQKKSVF